MKNNKISQSMLLDMVGDYCQYYIKLRHIDKVQTEPSAAMEDGLAFESKLIGSSRDGFFELRKKKNGEPLKRETDIDAVVEYAKMAMEESGIVVDESQIAWSCDIDGVTATGHIDATGSIQGKPIIIDVKFTGLSFEQYMKELQWSALGEKMRTQALQYQTIDEEKRDFLFLVFSSKGWARFFGHVYNGAEILQHEQRIKDAAAEFENLTFKPTIDANVCNACRLRDKCDKREVVPFVEPLPV